MNKRLRWLLWKQFIIRYEKYKARKQCEKEGHIEIDRIAWGWKNSEIQKNEHILQTVCFRCREDRTSYIFSGPNTTYDGKQWING
jgi:hypothetical protein